MKIVEIISEDQMISLFLKGELNSVRFSDELKNEMKELNVDTKVVVEPNLSSEQENLARRKLFGKYRGYGENHEIFEDFPNDMRWTQVSLSPEETLQIRYINYSYWDELSKQTHLPTVAAETIKSDTEIFNVSNKNFLKAAEFLRGGGSFPEMVLVARNENSPLIVLEGHLRLTAYALAPEYIPETLTAIVGFSENLGQWGNY